MPATPCLIFHCSPLQLTAGGPSGFLAHNLAGRSSAFYRLSEPRPPTQGQFPASSDADRRSQRERLRLRMERDGLANNNWLERFEPARQLFYAESAADYRWIWFHDMPTLYGCLDLLGADQKVILQPHCPQRLGEEALEYGQGQAQAQWKTEVERRAFARADVLVLPNEHVLPIFTPIIPPQTRVQYLLSGCRQLTASGASSLDPRNTYYLYLGRRMAIKGFDIVLDAFGRAHHDDESLRLILVGRGRTVSAPGVIDVGFSQTPAIWLSSCDYLVSANRQSYFDLSVMEALSLGTPLIIACTGGHRYFMDADSKGIVRLPGSEAGSLSQALLANRRKRSENQEASLANQSLFANQLSSDRYHHRLETLLSQMTHNI